jgi:hypothetical protein
LQTLALPEEFMPRLFGSAKSAILEKISHILIGFTLVIKGVDKAEHFNRHPFTVVFLFCAGAFIILGAFFHQRIEKKIPNFTALFHVAEGISLILVGLALLEGSRRLPYFFFFAGAVYLAIGAFEFFTDAAEKKELRPVLLAVLGTVFLLAALVAFILNFLGSNDSWVFIITGVFAVCGLFILLVRRKAEVHAFLKELKK